MEVQKIKIKDITLFEFLKLKDTSLYTYYLKYGVLEPLNYFNLPSFTELTFSFVKDMQHAYTRSSEGLTYQVLIDEIGKLKNISPEEFGNMSIFEMHRFRLHCVEEIEKINNMEEQNLGYSPTAEQVQAGLERFSIYGGFLQYDALAGGDILKIDLVKDLPYQLCFTKLKLDADRANYKQDYDVIMKNKNKNR
jgi:hypothetical protein